MEKGLDISPGGPANHPFLSSDSMLALLGAKYLTAKEYVIREGYAEEIDWQHEVSLEDLNETNFLCQASWVILCSGMRETVVRRCFDRFSESFFWWESAEQIVANRSNCRLMALRAFGNPRKVDAVISVASHVLEAGMDRIYQGLQKSPIDYLCQLNYIGPITAWHLAKNLGVPVAKPDRHLTRLANALQFGSAGTLCGMLAEYLSEPIQVVDVVLWRFATLRRDYIKWFTNLSILNEGEIMSGLDQSWNESTPRCAPRPIPIHCT
jgi:hypothetical protein